MRVTVVGAGIIGTTSAFRIKRRFPDVEMTVIAEKFSPDTTSDIGKVLKSYSLLKVLFLPKSLYPPPSVSSFFCPFNLENTF